MRVGGTLIASLHWYYRTLRIVSLHEIDNDREFAINREQNVQFRRPTFNTGGIVTAVPVTARIAHRERFAGMQLVCGPPDAGVFRYEFELAP